MVEPIELSVGGTSLVVDPDRGTARLTIDGHDWGRLSLLASVDRTDTRDETHDIEVAVREEAADRVVIAVGQGTSAWQRKTTVVTCTPAGVELHVEVEGEGTVDQVSLLGGRAILPTGAAGVFRSQITAQDVFDPTPTEPVAFVRPATSTVQLGIVGDAEPGRLNAIFSPPPLVLALGGGSRWLGIGVREEVRRLTFTQLRYEPLDGGYLLRLDHEGHTRVRGSWSSPRLVLAPADSPWDAVAGYREHLAAHDLAPDPPTPAQDWWRRAIFCGWGAQCAQAARSGGSAMELSRQDRYDGWLARLADHGLRPGTIVVDDQWQAEYGLPEPHPDRWPRLEEWIAERHRDGQRVLLWWRAWAPHGLPVDECVVDARGRPVAADPTHPAYRERLRETMAALLGPDGLDADGLKVDFTQRAPSGSSLVAHGDSWGVAMLHELLTGIYTSAKQAKPDSLVITHTPHPSFGDVCDMVRLNDVLESDPTGAPVPASDQLRARHAVATRSLPHHLVDTDQWPMQTRADWLGYAEEQVRLGVPALYYVDSIDNSGEPITGADLEQVAAWWSGTLAP
jgi:hypothetical protein